MSQGRAPRGLVPTQRCDGLQPNNRPGELRAVVANRIEVRPVFYDLEVVVLHIGTPEPQVESTEARGGPLPVGLKIEARCFGFAQVLVGIDDERQRVDGAGVLACADQQALLCRSLAASNKQIGVLARRSEDRLLSDNADVVGDLVLPVVEAEIERWNRLQHEADRIRFRFFRQQRRVAARQLLELDAAVTTRNGARRRYTVRAQYRIVESGGGKRRRVRREQLCQRRGRKAGVIRGAQQKLLNRRIAHGEFRVGRAAEVAVVVVTHRCTEFQTL